MLIQIDIKKTQKAQISKKKTGNQDNFWDNNKAKGGNLKYISQFVWTKITLWLNQRITWTLWAKQTKAVQQVKKKIKAISFQILKKTSKEN